MNSWHPSDNSNNLVEFDDVWVVHGLEDLDLL